MKNHPTQMTALAVMLAAAFPAVAQNAVTPPATPTLAPVIVSANGTPTRDSDATYASEVHDRAAIDASGAVSLYDYLAKHTTLNVLSGGNQNAPLTDMRGYGLETGYQNMVIVVDGYRLNNIDQTSAYLGGIALDSVERIEVSKGSGSVLFGDGAMSGVLNIRTRNRTGASFSAMTGSRGAQALNVSAGYAHELFDVSLDASNTRQASLSAVDTKGVNDGSNNRSERANLTLKPMSGLKLLLGASEARVDTRYPAALTPSQFNTAPGASWGKTYNHQVYDSSQWRAGLEYEFVPGWTARYMHNEEDKRSRFIAPSLYSYDYNHSSDDVSLAYRSASFDLTAGLQRFNGKRTASNNLTSKDSDAAYVQGNLRLGAWAFSAGLRQDRVKYVYTPTTGASNRGAHNLSARDLGANYRFNEQLSAFVNYNQAYQAPDIDRFFDFGGSFNGLIDPAKVKTVTAGVNHDLPNNRLRVAVFRSNLDNEIYYNPVSGANTNLKKSHKYGLELSERWQASDSLALSAKYTFTKAVIDTQSASGTSYNGKEVPGVPRNTVVLGIDYKPWAGGALNVAHTWRDSAYAISNFANDDSLHRQSIYSSTSLAFRQRWKNIEGFVGIDNLFDRQNGQWVYANYTTEPVNVYPVDFRRTARVGIKVDLF